MLGPKYPTVTFETQLGERTPPNCTSGAECLRCLCIPARYACAVVPAPARSCVFDVGSVRNLYCGSRRCVPTEAQRLARIEASEFYSAQIDSQPEVLPFEDHESLAEDIKAGSKRNEKGQNMPLKSIGNKLNE